MTLPARRYVLGEDTTKEEVRAAWARMHPEMPLKSSADLHRALNFLAKERPLRLEFEINRYRGFDLDHGES